jgi:hypothetical protein
MKKNNLLLSVLFALLTFLINYGNSVLAADIQITAYVEGGLTLTLNGNFGTSIPFPEIVLPMAQNVSRKWFSNNAQDYISYVDDTTLAGFHLKWNLTNFNYSGSSQSQGPINTSNFTIFGEYSGSTPMAVTKGYDDPTKNLSILPNSCASATIDTFTFHNNFTNSEQNYSLNGSIGDQVLISSTVNCVNIGHIRFDMTQLVIPQSSDAGTYTGTMTWTIVDGLP